MMTTLCFFAGLEGITISDDLGKGVSAGVDLLITDQSEVKDALLTENTVYALGAMQADWFRSCPALLMSVVKTDQLPTDKYDAYIDQAMGECHSFLQGIWLVQDHSINFHHATLVVTQSDDRCSYITNSLVWYASTSAGQIVKTAFSASDLKLAAGFTKQIRAAQSGDTRPTTSILEAVLAHQVDPSDSIHLPLTTRVQLAFNFLALVQNARDLGLRLAYYCSCFETLFSTDASEMTHKIAERAAYVLGSNGEDRLRIYDVVRKAYTVRSQVIHGDTISKKLLPDLRQLCVNMDSMLRQCLRAAIGETEFAAILGSRKEELDTY